MEAMVVMDLEKMVTRTTGNVDKSRKQFVFQDAAIFGGMVVMALSDKNNNNN